MTISPARDRAVRARLDRLPSDEGERRSIPGEELWFPPTTLAGVTVTPDSALTLTAAFAAINVLATDTAALDFSTYRHLPDGGKAVAPEQPTHALIHTTPDEETSAFSFRQTLMGHVLGWGNGYARVSRRGNGAPYRLTLLDPKSTRPVRVGRDDRLGYATDDGAEVVPADDVIHVAGLGFDGLSGYSPAKMARQAIALGLAAEAFGATFFGNGTQTGGWLKVPGRLKPEAKANIRESLQAIHQGPYNAHKVGFLEEGMEWVKSSVDPEDAQFLATRQFQVIEVARIYRVPPHKLMDYSQAHLANVEESNTDYLMTSLMPWLVTIEAAFNLKLFTRPQRQLFFAEHNMNTLLRGNMAARAGYYKEMFAMGVMSINDILRAERLNPIGPEGDKRFVPLNITTVENAGRLPTPPPALRTIKHEGGRWNVYSRKGRPLGSSATEAEAQERLARVESFKRRRREPRHNPYHGPDGKFAEGPGGASSAKGHYVPSGVTGVEHYDRYQGDEAYGRPIPPLSGAETSAIEARVLKAAAPSQARRARGRWKGRLEDDVLSAVHRGHAADIDDSIRRGAHDEVKMYLTASGDETNYARGLARAREAHAAADRLVRQGRLVRTEETWEGASLHGEPFPTFRNTRLRHPMPHEVPPATGEG